MTKWTKEPYQTRVKNSIIRIHRYAPTCSNMFKYTKKCWTWLSVFKLQTCSHMFTLVKMGLTKFRHVLKCSTIFRHVNIYKSGKAYWRLKIVQLCSNMFTCFGRNPNTWLPGKSSGWADVSGIDIWAEKNIKLLLPL